jgi:hypothetical protein
MMSLCWSHFDSHTDGLSRMFEDKGAQAMSHTRMDALYTEYSYIRNRPWRPIGLWDVKDPTLSRQSADS